MNDLQKKPQDDLPYERRMLSIIRGYRWLLEQNERLANYAHSLEKRILELEEKKAKQSMYNKDLYRKLVDQRRENRRLKAHMEWLEEQIESIKE